MADSETAPLLVHRDRFQWLDAKWVLGLAATVFSLPTPFLVGISGYAATIIGVTLAAALLGMLIALRGCLRSRWIKDVIDNNENVFFELAMALGEGRALGLWDDTGQDERMNWVGSSYNSIRRQMLEQLDVRLPACASVSQTNEVLEGLASKSQSYAGLRQIRNGRFAQEFRERGFGIDA